MAKRAWGGAVQGREEQHRLKRQAVLEAAASVIRRKSYSETTLTDVADALHISKPTLYYYFESKDQIMFEIQRLAIEMIVDRDPADLDSPFLPGLGVADRLARFVRRYVRMITSDYGACLIMTPRQALTPETRRGLIAAIRPIDKMMIAIIQDGAKEGLFEPTNARLAANYAFGALNWIPYWYRSDGAASVEEIASAAIAHIIHSLSSPNAAAPRGKARSMA